ncbi:MAG: hypothetical protein Ct9H300mP28_25190 [Pseudomonadota bacterium]|nr:MAG: hypothetical protein Ct9H300mP28_25190 [Pseudomonadota bacterium]
MVWITEDLVLKVCWEVRRWGKQSQIEHNGQTYVPPHLSKDQNIHVQAGDKICVSTLGRGYESALSEILSWFKRM